MSLQTAERGEKEHLSGAWSASGFDFELACRAYGRNDAFWVLCYRLHLAGEPAPDEREVRALIKRANRATGGLNRQGERERYTRYEASQTIEQVSRYRGKGLRPLVDKRRRSRAKISLDARKVLDAACQVAEMAKCSFFSASHRRLGTMAGVHPCHISACLYELEAKGLIFRRGFTKPMLGRKRGTTCLSLKPPRPAQRVDEAEPPRWDPKQARWAWTTPLARGTISQSRLRWLTSKAKAAANVPYVYGSTTSHSPSAFQTSVATPNTPRRGPP